MDPFLRRVIAQREREQEAAILTAEDWAAAPCRVCGGAVNLTEPPQLTVCSKCGGRKTERRLQQQDEARAVAPPPEPEAPEVPMSKEQKVCTRCGKGLRSDNTRGVCSKRCQPGSAGETIEQREPAPRQERREEKTKVSKAAETLNRFRLLAEAVGFDPDQVLAEFAESWLQRARSAVRPTTPAPVDLEAFAVRPDVRIAGEG